MYSHFYFSIYLTKYLTVTWLAPGAQPQNRDRSAKLTDLEVL